MQKILIYNDEGVHQVGVKLLLRALQQEAVDSFYDIRLVKRSDLYATDWIEETKAIIFPGGRDIPYHEALQGTGNRNIATFVRQGGSFLGICAGGYYGSKVIEFEKGGPLEVTAHRELQFFPGIARGPAYGFGKFCYTTQEGAQIAQLQLSTSQSPSASYFNGGCTFVDASRHDNVSVLAHYTDIKEKPAAIVSCSVEKGRAILCGVHPEYSARHLSEKYLGKQLYDSLQKVELERRALFRLLLDHTVFI